MIAVLSFNGAVRKMNNDTAEFNAALSPSDREICDLLAQTISDNLPEAEPRSGTAIPSGSWMATRSSVTVN